MAKSSKSNKSSRDHNNDEPDDEGVPAELEDYEEELNLIRVDAEEEYEGRAWRTARESENRPHRVGRRRSDGTDWVHEAFGEFMSRRRDPKEAVPASPAQRRRRR
jgi:hypothetical protein